MKEKLNIEFIRQALNRSSSRLDQKTVDGLRSAREQALARYDARRTAPAWAWAGAGHGSGHPAGSHRSPYLYWAAAALLAAALFGGTVYWKHAMDHDINEEDIAILTDELPIEVFVD